MGQYLDAMGTLRAYVDESKSNGYLMVAVLCDSSNVGQIAKALRSLVLPGQRRLHMVKESKSRKNLLTAKIGAFELETFVARSNEKYEPAARQICLSQLVNFCINAGVQEIIIERDESFEASDKLTLAKLLKRLSEITYRHESPQQEPMLWIADIYAWNLARNSS